MAQPTYTPLSAAQLEALDAALGLAVSRQAEPCVVDVGPRWIVAQLPDAQAVLGCQPDFVHMAAQDRRGGTNGMVIFGEHPAGHATRIEVRAFAPAFGINEDPVCGSGNGCVGAFIRDRGLQAHFGEEILASQGTVLGRAGLIRLSLSGQGIQVGGSAITCVDGALVV